MSDTMRWFVGGQQALMPELLAMVACTVNSYSRLVPGFWAPTSATWGIENRTTALRVIRGGPASQRVEYRIAAADINPYIALAAAIGSGVWGIGHRIDPDPPNTISPAAGRVYVERSLETAAGIDRALDCAQRAQPAWRSLPLTARCDSLESAVDAFVANASDIAAEITWQMGRPIRHSPGEVRGFEERARYMLR